MRQALLDKLACPACGDPFALNGAVYEGEEIVAGSLDSTGCDGRYAIEDGLPMFAPDAAEMERTRKGFSDQWCYYDLGCFETGEVVFGESHAKRIERFKRVLETVGISSLEGKVILDAGCGSGVTTVEIAKAYPNTTVIGVDICDCARQLHNRTQDIENLHAMQADLRRLPLAPGQMDVVWSMGVLHHTPDTRASFAKLAPQVKPGGTIYIWLYPRGGRDPYDKVRDMLVRAHRLPAAARYALRWLFAIPIYFAYLINGLAKGRAKRHLVKIPSIRFHVLALFDRLSPEFQFRHDAAEVRGWFAEAGLEEPIAIGNGGFVARRATGTTTPAVG